MAKLVKPSVKYKKSFLTALNSLYLHPYRESDMRTPEIKKDFAKFVKILRSQSKGENLRKGWVPHTTYWLVDGVKYLGSANIRHRLNKDLRKIGGHIGYEIRPKERGKGFGKLILKLALKKAKSLGIQKVLVACDATNIRSQKVIKANGGKYAGRTTQEKNKPDKLRYWIKIK